MPDDEALERHPHHGRYDEGRRNRGDEITILPGRPLALEETLDDVGRVGAEHEHLAMGHVDHAHEAEGDGETQRRQQQDAAQTETIEQLGGLIGPPLLAIDPVQCLRRRRTDGSVNLGIAGQGRDQGAIAEPAGLPQNRHCLQPHGRIRTLQIELGHGQTQPVTNRRIGLLFQRRPQHGIGFGHGLFGHRAGAGQTLIRIGRGNLHLSPHGPELPPQGVGQGWRGQFDIGWGRLAIQDVTPTVGCRTIDTGRVIHLQLTFGELGQQRERVGIGAAGQRIDGLSHVTRTAQTQGGDRSGQGVGCALRRKQMGWRNGQTQHETNDQLPEYHGRLTPRLKALRRSGEGRSASRHGSMLNA